jgi:HAD superfamily hydrolase (TIGR01450 family)
VLGATDEPLVSAYDLAMLDLDGVVYIGDEAVPGAPEAVDGARARGMSIAFITNSAAREPGVVAAHLSRLGIAASAHDVVTSAQAAARLVRERAGAGTSVFLAGGPGVEEALLAEGLVPTEDEAAARFVVTGYGPDLPWRRILQAAILVRAGVPWIATNADLTIPTASGVGPGHGALVRLIEEFSGVTAVVAGKPARPLLDETVRRVGGARPLMVGDRLDTDIEGAHNAGVDSLLVLTGVSGLDELVVARHRHRPTYLASDLAGLLRPHSRVSVSATGATCGGWRAEVVDGELVVGGAGDRDDCWRALAVAGWQHLDTTGSAVALSEGLRSVALAP